MLGRISYFLIDFETKALMPSGDHLNIIDPPGLTVMRIAGGRYRVTAAHRVVWTWMNEFASISFDVGPGEERSSHEESMLQIGDLVTLTIVVCILKDLDCVV